MKAFCLIAFCLICREILAIKFEYNLDKHQLFCFNEQVEKQSRYQVVVMGASNHFGLQVFEEQKSVFEDSRSEPIIKTFSSFSGVNGVVLVCISNQNIEKAVNVVIEFYHGLHLEPGFGDIDFEGFTQIREILAQSNQIQSLVKRSYEMNVKTLVERNRHIDMISTVMLAATLIFLLSMLAVRLGLLRQLVKQMRLRKLI